AAVVAGVTANLILGASSLFWLALSDIPTEVLLCYRILASYFTLAVLVLMIGQCRYFISSLTFDSTLYHLGAALLIAINWGTFVWSS
ncbi:rarD protein, partial [Undibacterium sp. 10I3]|nr:rarD protein [Undibacterium sp. 10I3]